MIRKESILKGSILTSVFNLTGKLLGFVAIYIITREFGASEKTDIYYLLLSFSMLLIAIFSTLQSSVFIPLYIKTKTVKGEQSAWTFSNSFFTYSFLKGFLLSLLFLLFPLSLLKFISRM